MTSLTIVADLLSRVARRRLIVGTLPYAAVIAGISILSWSIASRLYPEAAFSIAVGASVAAIAAIGGVLAIRLWLSPSQARVAARLDRELGLQESLSTAIGLDTSLGNPVSRALSRDASRVAEGLDPGTLVPGFGRSSMFVLAFLAASIGVGAIAYLAPQPARPDSGGSQSAEAPTTVTSTELEAVAKLLAEDAKRTNNDYLEAVSRSVEQLAEQLAAGRPAEAVAADLEALLEHARAGYEGAAPAWLGGETGDVASVPSDAQATADAMQKVREERKAASGTRPDAGVIDMYDLARRRTEENAALVASSAQDEASAPDTDGRLSEAGPSGSDDFAASPMQSEQLQNAGSFPVGGAAQSGKGRSNVAGGGTQSLLDDTGFLQSMPDPTAEMALTAADAQDNGRIRLFVPTTAEASASTGTVDGALEFARLAAQVVNRQAVAGDAIPVVSRYFNNRPEAVEGPR